MNRPSNISLISWLDIFAGGWALFSVFGVMLYKPAALHAFIALESSKGVDAGLMLGINSAIMAVALSAGILMLRRSSLGMYLHMGAWVMLALVSLMYMPLLSLIALGVGCMVLSRAVRTYFNHTAC